ncbi:hypothetical protein [Methanobrevibacter oralis]|nr:hypothetical protein [Methanobrevibacter oralis]
MTRIHMFYKTSSEIAFLKSGCLQSECILSSEENKTLPFTYIPF